MKHYSMFRARFLLDLIAQSWLISYIWKKWLRGFVSMRSKRRERRTYPICRVICAHHQKAPECRERLENVRTWVIPFFTGSCERRCISAILYLVRHLSQNRDISQGNEARKKHQIPKSICYKDPAMKKSKNHRSPQVQIYRSGG